MKGYKVFNPDWTCRGKQYSCPGTFEQEGKLKICENGIHFCKKLKDCFNYYEFDPDNKVAEIETIGEIIEDKIEGKYCTSKIKIVRELNWHEVLDLVNIGKNNIGFKNTGDYNSGNYNTGHYNSGDYNSGNHNPGTFNAGNYNIGDGNSGHYNSGDFNSGNWNTGVHNTGYYNSGNRNTGHYNSGYNNTGDYNSGNYNTGDYNIGDRSSGCFNTEKNNMIFFNKQSDWTYKDWVESKAKKILNRMEPKPLSWTIEYYEYDITEEEKEKHPEYKTRINGFLERVEEEKLYSLRQKWWKDLSEEDKKSVLNLPNFDANIFKKITGIDVTIEK